MQYEIAGSRLSRYPRRESKMVEDRPPTSGLSQRSFDCTGSWQSMRGRSWCCCWERLVRRMNGFLDADEHNAGGLYTRKIKMGAEKENWGRVGFARILCMNTQLSGSATEKQREQRRPGSEGKVKSGALLARDWGQTNFHSRRIDFSVEA